MEVRFWAATDTGRKRGHNEDNYLIDRSLGLFVVCDGMGGHAAGEVASAVGVETIREKLLAEASSLLEMREGQRRARNPETFRDEIATAVQRANKRIWEMGEADESRRGMGATCVMLVFVGDTAYGAHVGDSRIYRMRDGNAEQLTEDHTLRNHMIREGKLEEGEPMNRQNAVTRAIGVAQTVDVDTFSVDLQPGDRFLLCSDGLTEYLEEARQLSELAGHQDLEAATRRCIDHANQSGGKDNVTVMMVDVADGEGVWDARQSSAKGRALRRLPHFANLGPDEFGRVIESFQFQQVDKGAELLHPANAAEGLFLVVDGEVSLTDGGQDAGAVGAGEYFGERALLGAASAGLEAVAERTSQVAYLGREDFEALLGADVELAAKISWNFLRGIMHRLRPMSESEYRRPGDALVDNRKTARMKAVDREDADGSPAELGADDSKPPPIPGGRPGGPKRAIPRPGGDSDEGDETADMEQDTGKPFDGVSGAATVSSRGSAKQGKKSGRSSKSKSKRRGGGRKNRETLPMNSEDDGRNQD